MIRITLEFPTLEHAAEALRALGAPVAAPAAAPQPDVAVEPAPPIQQASAAATPPKPERKQRTDKGQPRGPLARTVAKDKPAPVAADKAPAPGQQEQHQTVAPAVEERTDKAATLAPAAAAPSKDDVVAAGKAVYDARGLDTARALLQRMGAETMRDLKPEQWAEYVRLAADVVAGKYDPLMAG